MGEERKEFEKSEYEREDIGIDSDSETDDEQENLAREKRKQNELYYKNLKTSMMSSLGLSKKNLREDDGRPEDYFYNSKYHPTLPGPLKIYLENCSVPAVAILDREDFNNGIIMVIIIAGINVGIQTYPAMDQLLFFKIPL